MVRAQFRNSGACHALKTWRYRLLKQQTSARCGSRDILKQLADDSKARAEKPGGVDWSWCWAGEAARDRSRLTLLSTFPSCLKQSNIAESCIHSVAVLTIHSTRIIDLDAM